MHTLCLLDIKVKEQSVENLLKGNKIFEPPRYMSVNQAIKQLLLVEEKRKDNGKKIKIIKNIKIKKCFFFFFVILACSEDSFAIGVARLGADDQTIISGTLKELLDADFGAPLHSLVLPGEMHHMEKKWFDFYRLKKDN